ncbi:PTS system mannose/fructose/N-acetylgalactosamine-transporter subunit IIB [Klebsiella variicola]|uniref:PTS system mannose/fructose/N-acetylgalactosamine-transporter subunit IIB n=1 Tax=Klebsiella variicola TaxID=244366 RepID=UPI0012AB5131|nr:PTS system mannose/fructose/N-acetylgalactosamine-transporter subunit IIB [Klebsiella variicola]MCS5939773.1 PTS sugar transporter subunit IIB [Klebsiella variicola subsp. variicola]
MNILISRIDDRYIHGQVVTRWVKDYPAERIIVVSDKVANDELRKSLLLSVAPSHMKASVVTVEKMIKAYHSERYEGVTVFLLFGNPTDVLHLVEGGVKIPSVNIGGMIYEEGRKQLTKSVSATPEDIAAFKKLHEKGVQLELRQLPSDSAVDFYSKIE